MGRSASDECPAVVEVIQEEPPPPRYTRFIPSWCVDQVNGRVPSRNRSNRVLVLILGLAAIFSGLIITILFLCIFVARPRVAYDVATHNFISENPILKDGRPVDGLNRWLDNFSRSVAPIMCHSHNDYQRPYPLFSALAAGCTGVEADVWLSKDGKDLLVGHDPAELTPERTLRSLYLEPLLKILETENPNVSWANNTVYDRARGVFKTHPNTTLALLIDVKTDGAKTWPLVLEQLEELRAKRFLTRFEQVPQPAGVEAQTMWPAPITVVGSGNLDRVLHSSSESRKGVAYAEYHDTFIDAPLHSLPADNDASSGSQPRPGQKWDKTDAYYASTSFKRAIGSVVLGFSDKQLATLRSQIHASQQAGLKSRYWGLPTWPIGYRDYVWDVLVREGVDMLNIDDIESAAKRGWTSGYTRDVIWMWLLSAWIVGSSLVCIWLTYRANKKWEKHAQNLALP